MLPLCIRVPEWLRTALWHVGALEDKPGTAVAREWLEEKARSVMPMEPTPKRRPKP